ncbi:mitochondrial carrier homolog 1-like isoform X2 [Zophobas morio]|uniref:mitochondrial carrier homolog 1-like isoform X2 n=1 Tax=Zophobas morio TaxID=2755281 RepID=UPI003083D9EB
MTNVALQVFLYPLEYVRILIQLGYEPLPPKKYTLFRRDYYYLPSAWTYARHVLKQRGFLEIFMGCPAFLLHTAFRNIVTRSTKAYFYKNFFYEEATGTSANVKNYSFQNMLKEMSIECAAAIVGTFVSLPFLVASVRSVAYCLEGSPNAGMMTCLLSLLDNNHIGPIFMNTFVPLAIAEVLLRAMRPLAVYLLSSLINPSLDKTGYLTESKFDSTETDSDAFLKLTLKAIHVVVAHCLYPLSHVTTRMCVSCSKDFPKVTADWPRFSNWAHCWSYLREARVQYMGSQLLTNRVLSSNTLKTVCGRQLAS